MISRFLLRNLVPVEFLERNFVPVEFLVRNFVPVKFYGLNLVSVEFSLILVKNGLKQMSQSGRIVSTTVPTRQDVYACNPHF